MGSKERANPLRQWWRSRCADQRRIADAVLDLHERYGPAAAVIARSSARQRGGYQHVRFWRNVARQLRRRPPPAEAF
jgi:hypothetical protein